MSLLKKLAGQTAIYGLTTIVGRFLNYLLTPLHTTLPPEDYGVITELYAYIALLNVIFTYGMETTYFRFATKDHNNQGLKAYNNALTSIFLSSLFFSGGIFLFSSSIAAMLGYPDKAFIIQWIALILGIDAIVAIPFARIRLLNKVYLFAGAKIASIFLNIFFNIFFLYLCPLIVNEGWFPGLRPLVASFYDPGHSVAYIFASNLLANLAYFPFLSPAFRGIKISLDIAYWKSMLVYGFPILLMGIAGTVNEMFSRLMLKELLPANFYPGLSNEAALGVFGACYKLSVFMALAIQAFRFASEPFFFSNSTDKNAPGLFAKVMTYFVICCIAIFILVSINVDLLSGFLISREEYKTGLAIVPVLMMANLFMGIYFNLSVWYKLTDKTYWGTYITLFGAVVTVVANYLLIPLYGYYGSVWATFACYFLMAASSYMIGQKYFPIPYKILSIVAYLIVGILILFACRFIGMDNVNNLLICNTVAIVAVGAMFVVEATWRNKHL